MRSVLAELRALCPPHALPPWEARGVAERQASRLLRICDVHRPPVPEEVVSDLAFLRVQYVQARTIEAAASWISGSWMIIINREVTVGRQRFSLAHEFKHVLDHPVRQVVYRDRAGRSAEAQAERAADCFAAALLMPRPWVKRAFCDKGIQSERELARLFGVSVTAMRVRLDELALRNETKVAA